MTIKETWPKFEFLHVFQPRLDKEGQPVEDFISRFKETSHGELPPEIARRGTVASLLFLEKFGWAYISNLICELYSPA